jgi:hypothetical protein
MLFDPPEVWLAKFTARNGKKKSITRISPRELSKWRTHTSSTNGRFLKKFMAPALWSDSLESLQTAATIVNVYAPQEILASDGFQSTLSSLRRAILREHRRLYIAKHGPFKK